jgi:glycosyltransferase involved in cell wall biosynthesis
MSEPRIVYLCSSFAPYWVQIFDTLNDRLGSNFTVITQSFHSGTHARLAQGMGKFQRKVIIGGRISLSGRESEGGRGTPFGLNIAPSLPWTLFRLRPRVVITNNFGLWTLAAIAMGYSTVVFWEGTFHTERTVKNWRRRIRQWIVKRAGAFVVNGTAAREYLHKGLGVDEASIFIGGLCSDPPPSEFRRHAGRTKNQNDPINFLFVGRLIKGKGVDHLLNAAALLNKMVPSPGRFTITVVGDGSESSELVRLAKNLGIAEQVHFVGELHPNGVWQHYAEGDVFVLPTLQDNWPLVVLEAMSMGLPILLSRHAGSVPDLISENGNGHSFDPYEYDTLASLMKTYIDNPNLTTSQGARSLEIVELHNPMQTSNVFMSAVDFACSGKTKSINSQ